MSAEFVAFSVLFRRRKARNMPSATAVIAAKAAPTPIPAFAPVESPPPIIVLLGVAGELPEVELVEFVELGVDPVAVAEPSFSGDQESFQLVIQLFAEADIVVSSS